MQAPAFAEAASRRQANFQTMTIYSMTDILKIDGLVWRVRN